MPVLELYCTVGIWLLGIFAIVHSSSLPVMGPIPLSPAMFPLIIGLLMVLLSTMQIIHMFRQYGIIGEDTKNRPQEVKIKRSPKIKGEISLILMIMMLLLYLYVLPVIHFIPSTLIFLILFMSYIHHKISLKIIVISVVVTLLLFYSFSMLFKLLLP